MVRAPNNSTRNVYVQGLRVNGRRWNKTYLPHSMLANGATLTFDMGPRPSGWATTATRAPPSLTEGREPARPLRDATGKHGARRRRAPATMSSKLFDDSSATEASTGNWVEYAFAGGVTRASTR